jgi:predicted RNase H-like HicB family nuclease
MKFNLVIEIDSDGRYVVECTDLPGCLSEGDTLKEAIENINEAIVGCLRSRLKVAG